jgi:hypothetical protein
LDVDEIFYREPQGYPHFPWFWRHRGSEEKWRGDSDTLEIVGTDWRCHVLMLLSCHRTCSFMPTVAPTSPLCNKSLTTVFWAAIYFRTQLQTRLNFYVVWIIDEPIVVNSTKTVMGVTIMVLVVMWAGWKGKRETTRVDFLNSCSCQDKILHIVLIIFSRAFVVRVRRRAQFQLPPLTVKPSTRPTASRNCYSSPPAPKNSIEWCM